MHNGVVLNYELFILHAMIVMNLDYSKKYVFGNGMNSMYDNLDTSLVTVCYGGFVSVKVSSIVGRRNVWKKMKE